MKPTRNIVKPTGMWNPKGKVWYQKNDDKLPDNFVDEKLKELRENPKEFKKKLAKLTRETNKLAREEGYAGGWKHFAKENK